MSFDIFSWYYDIFVLEKQNLIKSVCVTIYYILVLTPAWYFSIKYTFVMSVRAEVESDQNYVKKPLFRNGLIIYLNKVFNSFFILPLAVGFFLAVFLISYFGAYSYVFNVG